MMFISTRGAAPAVSLSQAIAAGAFRMASRLPAWWMLPSGG